VHLNLPFREPLVEEPGPLPAGRSDGRPWHRVAGLDGGDAAWRLPAGLPVLHAPRGLIVAGRGAGDPVVVHRLAEAAGWPVLADPLSGCRVPAPTTVAAFDSLLRVPTFAAAHQPDVVLRLGGGWWPDPDRTAGTLLRAQPEDACRALLTATDGWWPEAAWLDGWRAAEEAAQGAIDAELARAGGPTEPGLARQLLAAMPAEGTLVVSSSMPIRDLEWFGRPRSGVRVLANRGANGIDGVTSTVLGVAAAEAGTGGPVVGLLGDLAFLHDVNGLLISDVSATLVVVDNHGGGIFSFLPQRSSLPPDRFEALFGTPQGVDVVAVAAAHGWPVAEADGVDALALPLGARQVVVVRTDRDENVSVHERLHTAVATAVTALASR
jgi:2-succinyl-5-enolpyruvyl-6-hydroxy-3-cyclohexene-1-carboxylate synthase